MDVRNLIPAEKDSNGTIVPSQPMDVSRLIPVSEDWHTDKINNYLSRARGEKVEEITSLYGEEPKPDIGGDRIEFKESSFMSMLSDAMGQVVPSIQRAGYGVLKARAESSDVNAILRGLSAIPYFKRVSDENELMKKSLDFAIEDLDKSIEQKSIDKAMRADVQVDDAGNKTYVFRRDPEQGMKKIAAGAISEAARQAPLFAATALTKNPAFVLGGIGAQVYGEKYAMLRGMNYEPNQASFLSMLYVATETLPEMKALQFVMGPTKTFMGRIGKAMFGEVASENLTEVWQIGLDKGILHPELSAKEAMSRLIEVSIATPITAAGLGMVGASVSAREYLFNKKMDRDNAQNFAILMAMLPEREAQREAEERGVPVQQVMLEKGLTAQPGQAGLEAAPETPAAEAGAEAPGLTLEADVAKKTGKIIREVLQIYPEEKIAWDTMKEGVQQGEPGKRGATETDTGEMKGYSISSTFPEYFKNKGYTKKAVLSIIDKVEKGLPITEKQKFVVLDLLNGSKKQLEKEYAFYDKQIEQERADAAKEHTPAEIAEAERVGQEEAFGEAKDDFLGEADVSFPEGEGVEDREYQSNKFFNREMDRMEDEDAASLEAKGEKPFEVDDKLILTSPHTGIPVTVNYRGSMPDGKAVVVLNGIQMPVPMEWLSRESKANAKEGELAGMPSPEMPAGPMKAQAEQQEAERLDFTLPEDKQTEIQYSGKPEKLEKIVSSKWQVQLSEEEQTAKRVNKTQIISYIEKRLGVPVRTRLTHLMNKMEGFYKTKEGIIRLKNWGELEPLTHEVAHHIDRVMKEKLGKNWRSAFVPAGQKVQARQELQELDYDQTQQRTSEGFAEYMRHYITGTSQAEMRAPTFHKHFQAWLKTDKELSRTLSTMKEMYNIWNLMGAEARALAQIDFKNEHKLSKWQNWWKDFREMYENELNIIRVAQEELGVRSRKNVRPTQDPFEMATYFAQKAKGVARFMVETAMVDEYGNKIGPSLLDIMSQVRKQEKKFIVYWVAVQAKQMAGKNIESGFDVKDVDFILNKYKSPLFDKVAYELTTWSDSLVLWMVKSGGLSMKTAVLMKMANPIYAPFKRVLQDAGGLRAGGKTFVKSTGVMRRFGSARSIYNPIESLMQNALTMVSKAHKIRVATLIADLSKEDYGGKWVSKIPLKTKAVKVKLEAVVKEMKKLGLDMDGVEDEIGDEMLTLFQQTASTVTGKDNVVAVFRNGKLELYELHPDLYKSLQGIDTMQLGVFMKPIAAMTRLLRLGTTGLNYIFTYGKNPVKDFPTYAAYSKHALSTPLDPFIGMYKSATAKEGDLAWRYKATGGDISTKMGYDRAQTMTIYDEMLLRNLGKMGKTLLIARHPIDSMRAVLNIPELGPRIAELEKSYEKYLSENPDWSEEDAWVAAFNDAQDVTINFTRMGRVTKHINPISFAFNASIQGPSKFFRSWKENPARLVSKGLLMLTVPALIQWYRNRDKEWYKNLLPAYKLNNIFFEFGDIIIRVPAPYDIGTVFTGLPVAALDLAYHKDPKMIDGLFKNIVDQIPYPTINAFQPLIDVATNKDHFDRPIESEGMRHLPVVERTREHTAEYAKILSEGFNMINMEVSPVQIEYLVNSYTGGFLYTLPTKLPERAEDIPFVAAFMLKNPEKPTRQIEEFFSEMKDLRLKSKSKREEIAYESLDRLYELEGFYSQMKNMYTDIREAKESGDIKEVERLYVDMREELNQLGFGQGGKK